MTQLTAVSQDLSPGDIVELFILDLTPLGVNEVWPFTSGTNGGKMVSFGGIKFTPIDLKSSGWKYNGGGQFPRPKIQIANTLGFLSGILFEYADGVGARLTRIKTYKQFLDGEADADSSMHYPPEIFSVLRKVRHNKQVLEWELASSVDQEGVKLPRRVLYRDTCTHQYRVPDGVGGFKYLKATCPYTGTNYFDETGAATTAGNDKCGLRLSDCKLRFPNQALPTRAFPGLMRTSVA